jgi:periodic tryptophan protein 2
MKYSYRFSNLCGTVYKCGNLCFHPDGQTLYSPIGNRVTAFQLAAHTSSTLDFETRSDVDRVAVSPDGRLLLVIDKDGFALAVNLLLGVVVHRFNFKARVRACVFSPDGRYFAIGTGKKLQTWRTPALEREFSPFVRHRVYTGHYDDITSVAWSPNGAYLVTGSKDLTARIYSLDPTPGFIPVSLAGHRERLVSVHFADQDTIYSVSRDGAVYVWLWTERPELSGDALEAFLQDGEAASVEGDDSGDGNEQPGSGAARRNAGFGKRLRVREGDGDESWNPAARLVAQGASSVLASRVRHPVPAPVSGANQLDPRSVARGEWLLTSKHYFRNDDHARVASAALHQKSGLLVVGLSNGAFSLYSLPSFEPVHSLSISAHEVHSCAVNTGGEWLAFGSRTLGQLLVWEWRSETYILRQQGHFYDLNTSAYSPNGQLIATGGDDGKVKVWNAATGFCFVTFTDHSAPVSAVTFVGGDGSGHGLAVLSASLDGTVRAYDLIRYRNFRTLAPPPGSPPVQFSCLAADEAGEIVCAGAMDPFNIYVWSLQTGRILDVLTGHEAPLTSLSFSTASGLLASGSWDKTVRLWDVFRTGAATETFLHGADVLAVAFRPDGEQFAAATLSGQIALWDVKRGAQTGTIDARRDAEGGRKAGDLMTSKMAAASTHFTTLAYTADGEGLLAGGRTKWVCLYATGARILLRRYQITHNRSLDGVLDKISSKMAPAAEADNDEDEHQVRNTLPGAKRGELSIERTVRPEVRTKCVVFSPTGRAFSVATTEGLLLYSLDDSLIFNPIDLGEDTTPEEVYAAIANGAFARALLVALHLGEPSLIVLSLDAPPVEHISIISTVVPLVFLSRLLDTIAARLSPATELASEKVVAVSQQRSATAGVKASPHIEFYLTWAISLLQSHGRALRERLGLFAGSLRSLQRAMMAQRDTLARLAESTRFSLLFATSVPADMIATLPSASDVDAAAKDGDDDDFVDEFAEEGSWEGGEP